MILANIPLGNQRVVIPREVRSASRSPEIHTRDGPPFGADKWISCCYACPHVDDCAEWRSQLFLTLSVMSRHEAGDGESPLPLQSVPAGTLFVIDPLIRHWLFAKDAWISTRTKGWIGVQWEVDRRSAKRLARKLVADLGGEWLKSNDKRYATWGA